MRKKVGNEEVKAQFVFVCVDPHKLTQNHLYTLLNQLIALERQRRLEEGHVTDFVAFVEGEQTQNAVASTSVSNTFEIDGEIARLTVADVQGILRQKIEHESEAFRKKGMKSTHPPHFLAKTKLVIVIGGTRFLMEHLHLYLEHEGLLRPLTFELLKQVALLTPAKKNFSSDDFLHVDVAHNKFYSGNVEAVGQLVLVKPRSIDRVYSTAELIAKL